MSICLNKWGISQMKVGGEEFGGMKMLNVQRLRMYRLANMQNLQVSMLTLKIPTTEKIHHSKYKHKYIKLVQHAIIIDINIFFRKSFRYYC